MQINPEKKFNRLTRPHAYGFLGLVAIALALALLLAPSGLSPAYGVRADFGQSTIPMAHIESVAILKEGGAWGEWATDLNGNEIRWDNTLQNTGDLFYIPQAMDPGSIYVQIQWHESLTEQPRDFDISCKIVNALNQTVLDVPVGDGRIHSNYQVNEFFGTMDCWWSVDPGAMTFSSMGSYTIIVTAYFYSWYPN